MDDNLENAAQEFERDLNDAAENAWKPVEESAEQVQANIEETHEAAQEQVAEAAETVEGGWSEVKEIFKKPLPKPGAHLDPETLLPPQQKRTAGARFERSRRRSWSLER
jgi:hypothetical protein